MRGVHVTHEPDRSVYLCARGEWQITLDRYHEARGGELTAEVEVATSREPRAGVLSYGKLNLASQLSQSSLARALAGKQEDVDWADVITQVTRDAVHHWRDGEAPRLLADVPRRTGSRWLLQGLVEYAGPTVLFARGGTGKSLLALAAADSLATGETILPGLVPARATPVVYLDWEADAETHQERQEAIGVGIDQYDFRPEVYYLRLRSSLPEAAVAVRRRLSEVGAGAVVIDSLGRARGGEPESAEVTLRLFAAIDSLRVPALCVDHMTKNGGRDQASPFGSMYTEASARLTFSLERAEEEESDDLSTIVLTNKKVNNGRRQPRRAYRVEFTSDAEDRLLCVRYSSVSVPEVEGMFERLPLGQQLTTLLRRAGRPMTVAELHVGLADYGVTKHSPATIRMELNRRPGSGTARFTHSANGTGDTRWSLPAPLSERGV